MPTLARPLPEKFLVAFSFAGEQRDLVRAIAEAVEKELGSPNVFFDEWFEHYIAGEGADLRLQEIYGERCALAVVCVSDRYGGKLWTLAEHAAIRARLMKARTSTDERDDLGILPIRVGEGEVKGILFSSIVPDVRTRTAAESAQLIIERLRLIIPSLAKGAPDASESDRPVQSPPLNKPMADRIARWSVGSWIFGGLLLAFLLAVLAIRWLSPTPLVGAGNSAAAGTITTLIDTGNELKQNGKYDEAVNLYTEALKVAPTFEVFYNRADAYTKKNSFENAIDDYDAAEKLNPQHFGVLYNRARSYIQIGKYKNAIADLDHASSIEPEDLRVYYNRANAYMKLGRVDNAIKDYSKVLEINPEHTRAFYNRAKAFQQKGACSEAETDYKQVIALEKEDGNLVRRAESNLAQLCK